MPSQVANVFLCPRNIVITSFVKMTDAPQLSDGDIMKGVCIGRIVDVCFDTGSLTMLWTLQTDDGDIELRLPIECAKAWVAYAETGSKAIAQAMSMLQADDIKFPDLVNEDRALVLNAYTDDGEVYIFVENSGPQTDTLMTVMGIDQPTRR